MVVIITSIFLLFYIFVDVKPAATISFVILCVVAVRRSEDD